MTETETRTPRLWIGCLAAYNEGKLHGEWYEVPETVDELQAQINEVIRSSPALLPEEWFFADSEGFHPWRPGEFPGMERVVRAAALIREHGGAAAGFIDNDESVLDYDEHSLDEAFREAYAGQWEKDEDYAYEWVSELGIPDVGYVLEVRPLHGSFTEADETWGDTLDKLSPYLDWGAIADAVLEGAWVAVVDGNRHYFRSV